VCKHKQQLEVTGSQSGQKDFLQLELLRNMRTSIWYFFYLVFFSSEKYKLNQIEHVIGKKKVIQMFFFYHNEVIAPDNINRSQNCMLNFNSLKLT